MRRKKVIKGLIITLSIISIFYLFLVIITRFSHSQKRYKPTDSKIDLTEILNKDILNDNDYDILLKQTGLTKIGIDRLHKLDNDRIMQIQDDYYSNYEIKPSYIGLSRCSCEYERPIKHVTLEEGDILITDSSHLSFYHFGHAELYIGDGYTLSIDGSGLYSKLNSADNFFIKGNFMVLRLKGIDNELKSELVSYAKENLLGLKYRLLTGILTRKNPSKLKYTQCSHIIYYLYNKFGYNLDSDKGLIVTPRDLARSNLLEAVQVYGFNPYTLWDK